ncbi:MAG: MFS transporter [Ideonella sp.]|nr:MFS transporter [Ideonella sp.]MCC7457755.1 MFS transporter [Nitrospira sp.]
MSAGPESHAAVTPVGGHSPPVRRVRVFAIIALALLMMSLDSTIVATALHSLQHGLGTSINWAGWTITAYSLGFVLMLPLAGRLSERYGCRRVFIGSVAAFTAASLCCGLAENIFVLIALRALQAAGGAGLTPSATGIVVEHFGDARDRAVSLFGSIFPIGAMIGPAFGGLFVAYWSWRGVFFVNVPIGLVIVWLALRCIPRDRPREQGAAFAIDVTDMLLLGGGLLAGMLAVSALGECGGHRVSTTFAVLAALAVIALWRFVHHIGRSANPFIAPRLIHGPGFGPVNLINTIFGGVANGAMTLIPLYAANRYGIGVFGAGALLIVQGLAAIAFSVTAAFALRRTGHRPPLYVGGTAIAIGTLLLAVAPPHGAAPFAWLAVWAFVIGAGRGTINPASRNAGLQLAPQHSSTLAALRTAALQVGSITTVSIVTAVLARFADPGGVQAWVYVVVALLLLAALPLVARVPEHRGAW